MREIKFRAWKKSSKEMIYNIECIKWFEDDSVIINNENPNCILMQYTGLKDFNDKEVFEGDILQTKYAKVEIFWNEYAAAYWYKNQDGTPNGAIPIYINIWEIIGNKYENPELLK